MIAKFILDNELDLDEQSPEVRVVRERQNAERMANIANECSKLANSGGIQLLDPPLVIDIPDDESFNTPPTTPEPGNPIGVDPAGCSVI